MTSSRLAADSTLTHNRRHDHRHDDRLRRNAGGHQRRQLVVPLNPGDREHGRDHGQDGAGAIEEVDRPIGVEAAHQLQQVAVLLGVAHELVEIAEGVEDDIQPGQAAPANEEHLHELSQQVAVDDPHAAGQEQPSRCSSFIGGPRACCARPGPARRCPSRIRSGGCTPKLKRMRIARHGHAFGRVAVFAGHVEHAFGQRPLEQRAVGAGGHVASGSSSQTYNPPSGRAQRTPAELPACVVERREHGVALDAIGRSQPLDLSARPAACRARPPSRAG